MTQIYTFIISLLLLVSGTHPSKPAEPVYLKCYGYSPCAACTSCNYCAYCNSGGSCGVCRSAKQTLVKKDTAKTKPIYTPKQSYSSQCRAITKKGTRCSRNARSNGYCWQHGGQQYQQTKANIKLSIQFVNSHLRVFQLYH